MKTLKSIGILVLLALVVMAAGSRWLWSSRESAILPTLTEINYVDGVTSSIQSQLDTKANNSDFMNLNLDSLLALKARKTYVDSITPTPFAAKIVEQKTRVTSQNINYTGTVRMVGVGQTYATLTAAATAASDLDILQLVDGTYATSAESGGYWLVNTNTKRLLVRGNSANNGAVIIHVSSATYGIRMRDCNSMTFENITFVSEQNYANGIIAMEVYINNNYFKAKNCIFTNTNTGSNAAIFSRASATAGTDNVYIEFDQCVINSAGTGSCLYYSTSGINEVMLINKCTFNNSGNSAILYNSAHKGKIAVYDSNFNMSVSLPAMLLGENTATPTNTTFVSDIRNNTFTYTGSFFDHAILAGRGTDKIYCVNNTFHSPAIDNGNNMALVIKTIASSIGNAYFAGNYMSSAKPLYIKGGSNCIIKYNTFVSNVAGYECLAVSNPVAEALSTGNIITHNNLIGMGKVIQIYPNTVYETASTSMKSSTMDYNRYYSTTNIFINDDTTGYSFDFKYNFWTNWNDVYSKYVSSPAIIWDENNFIIDNTTVN